jgi:hypothetical protein
MVLGRSYVIEYAAEPVLGTLLLLGFTQCILQRIPRLRGKTRQQVREPDLCIGFNSGAGQHTNYTWPTTFKLLIERKLPSVFTVRWSDKNNAANPQVINPSQKCRVVFCASNSIQKFAEMFGLVLFKTFHS